MSQLTETGKRSVFSPRTLSKYIIALGSNQSVGKLGPSAVLNEALALLEARGFVIRGCSEYYNTPAFPVGAGPNFVNAAALVESSDDPLAVLAHLHAVEAQMGRSRAVRWGARTLDLDLVAAGDLVLPDAKTHQYWCDLPLELQKTAIPTELILPHPRLAERAFVLVPLLDVAPQWCHPVSGKTVREMHDALSLASRSEVVLI
ncbi:2-amino-4-hydroxy-6-hydroxymethyldihydropteridine diphosphokinase [Sulfitobacter guttiformis]|uniref:2-amino-4-hydroxy-6-hydroxymethyldihydropteridine pyrophosphokinase n=1 Tax=Sulfitobacter guttiformis TaxID=74349 RepID=A0A420DQJ3_9RHOB|nr:2-amino-4-hydroxy-6-hydroxymethyldihydropteridine diphosphokinase [Sulfitobacter guttiformis]KIN73957.1 2-amino-4-hydroxy-6-hydroxymethyldihydropteridine pyrophosphokinase [Sulfitobacter guttiformis KCTC 32187]RKE96584.1 2-amino-4-hydroxy-6-hydroxymethyldihydropteridine diphosphokinase [Sulfitobacter guttiformis]